MCKGCIVFSIKVLLSYERYAIVAARQIQWFNIEAAFV